MADTPRDDQFNSRDLQGDGKEDRNLDKNREGRMDGDSGDDEPFTAGNHTAEIATNDGSVIETLDTVFHGTPGWSNGENISGSNRADYYEARSNGKSDVEEEQDELRARNKDSGQKD